MRAQQQLPPTVDDDALIDILELDADEAFVIYVAIVGKRPAGS